nr:ribonuclease H-like domain-containing protein [Tanacetum cinerariifolium]
MVLKQKGSNNTEDLLLQLLGRLGLSGHSETPTGINTRNTLYVASPSTFVISSNMNTSPCLSYYPHPALMETTLPHAFAAGTLHDPTTGAWNTNTGFHDASGASPIQHMWHQRLGHPGRDVLRGLVSNNVNSCNKEEPPVLLSCFQFKCEIRSFQCDHGGEFDNRNLHKLFAENGIQFRFSCKTSQQN